MRTDSSRKTDKSTSFPCHGRFILFKLFNKKKIVFSSIPLRQRPYMGIYRFQWISVVDRFRFMHNIIICNLLYYMIYNLVEILGTSLWHEFSPSFPIMGTSFPTIFVDYVFILCESPQNRCDNGCLSIRGKLYPNEIAKILFKLSFFFRSFVLSTYEYTVISTMSKTKN